MSDIVNDSTQPNAPEAPEERIERILAACIAPIYSVQSFGTPGKFLGLRCRLCNEECTGNETERLDHSYDCPARPIPPDPARCQTCNGHGLIGSMTREGGEGFPCPDCNPQSEPSADAQPLGLPEGDMSEDRKIHIPIGLHHSTKNLVISFAEALARKLRKSEVKYGRGTDWAKTDWLDECRADLRIHLDKGDPLDVAAYAAFLWHHNASTTTPTPPSAQGSETGTALQRYELVDRCRGMDMYQVMQKQEDGDYVRYEDVDPILTAAQRAAQGAEAENQANIKRISVLCAYQGKLKSQIEKLKSNSCIISSVSSSDGLLADASKPLSMQEVNKYLDDPANLTPEDEQALNDMWPKLKQSMDEMSALKESKAWHFRRLTEVMMERDKAAQGAEGLRAALEDATAALRAIRDDVLENGIVKGRNQTLGEYAIQKADNALSATEQAGMTIVNEKPTCSIY